MDLNTALKWLSASVFESVGHTLKEPELVILEGTWRGLTYEQMADGSAYSTNYLMRDVAPKLWRQLSTVFGRSVGKTSFRVALEAFAASNAKRRPDLGGPRFDNSAAIDRRFNAGPFASGGDIGQRLPTGALENYQAGARKRAEEARMGNSPTERGLYRHPAVLPDAASDRFTDPSLEQFNLSTAGETLYNGISRPVTSSVVMYGYGDELAQAKQWLEEAIPEACSQATTATNTDSETTESKSVQHRIEGQIVEGQIELNDGLNSSSTVEGHLESHLEGHLPNLDQQAGASKIAKPKNAKPKGQLVGIWGLRGVGKTLLTERLVAQMGDRFAAVVRRQITSRPTLSELSAGILTGLGVAAQPNRATAQLLRLMSQQPLLIVLEGIEAVLESKALAGDYAAAYKDYGEFFKAVPGSRSCVVITGLEGPAELVRQGGYGERQGVRSLILSQLSQSAATDLIRAELQPPLAGLNTSDANRDGQPAQPTDAWYELITRYQGHPMALKSALRVIRDFFNGQVEEFLAQNSALFTDILRMLLPSFERLSATEVNILYWLASQESSMSLAQLTQTLPIAVSSADLVSALDSLHQRSLIAITTTARGATFSPPALVKAYALHRFVDQFGSGTAMSSPAQNAAVGALTQSGQPSFSTAVNPVGGIIDLRPTRTAPVKLSRWIEGQYTPQWQSLDRLFEASARPGALVRATYLLQDETYIKRFKSIDLSTKADASKAGVSQATVSANADQLGVDKSGLSSSSSAGAVLLVAIHQEAENLYSVCVQAQPEQKKDVLPEKLQLRLLDSEQTLLADVAARQEDLFIQLPYFRGAEEDIFTIEMVLADHHHTETFTI